MTIKIIYLFFNKSQDKIVLFLNKVKTRFFFFLQKCQDKIVEINTRKYVICYAHFGANSQLMPSKQV